MNQSNLKRSVSNRMITGVCGGIGEHYGWDPTKVRLAVALLWLITGIVPLVIVYIIGSIIIPE